MSGEQRLNLSVLPSGEAKIVFLVSFLFQQTRHCHQTNILALIGGGVCSQVYKCPVRDVLIPYKRI